MNHVFRSLYKVRPQHSAKIHSIFKASEMQVPRQLPIAAVIAMSDSKGILQQVSASAPEGGRYRLDDNVRALMLMSAAEGLPPSDRMCWSTTFAAFVQAAWEMQRGHFREIMHSDGRWSGCEASEDAYGQALWGLGHAAELAPLPDIRNWARCFYDRVMEWPAELGSPLAIALKTLGAGAMLRACPGHAAARDALQQGGDILQKLLGGERRPDWAWFEAVVAQESPRLPQALIEAGAALGRDDWVASGVETLEWVCGHQVSSTGFFRPIGSELHGTGYVSPTADRQPLEAQATIEACLTAHMAHASELWFQHAMTAWRWFLGGNDQSLPIADLATGRCRGGMGGAGAHLDCGAESTLAFQLAHCAMLALHRRSHDALAPRSQNDTREIAAAEPLRA
ncbi:hypothetical protein [Novosphingobium sp. M1R2S20]|uniref:Glycosyltransferase n=1 Tax=Novosphingobium rhizovicinum TaxID=3228928 RepID=A0ABV3RA52_9SPHN